MAFFNMMPFSVATAVGTSYCFYLCHFLKSCIVMVVIKINASMQIKYFAVRLVKAKRGRNIREIGVQRIDDSK
jgi:hypothetical protein